jgi:Fic family protein
MDNLVEAIEAKRSRLERLRPLSPELVMKRSRPDLARYVRTETGRHVFPAPAEIPARMGDFALWLRTAPDTPGPAFDAHSRLVDIHPFNDGNGRTARLLMNLILIRGGYPPVAIRPEDRLRYIRALQESQAGLGASMLRCCFTNGWTRRSTITCRS